MYVGNIEILSEYVGCSQPGLSDLIMVITTGMHWDWPPLLGVSFRGLHVHVHVHVHVYRLPFGP